MSKKLELGLVVKKEAKFEKVRKVLIRIFFAEQYFIEQDFENLIKIRKIDTSKIIIPKEIGEKR